MPRRRRAAVLLLAVALLAGGCGTARPTGERVSGRRDIDAVLADHDRRLLALPGVVGVYVGLLEDGVTPCLKVMLAQDDPQVRRTLPPMLEGHPLIVEVTGEIRPLAPARR